VLENERRRETLGGGNFWWFVWKMEIPIISINQWGNTGGKKRL